MVLDSILGASPFRLRPTRSWKRSLAKTVTWRLFATVDTFVIGSLVTGSLQLAGSIVSIELVTKMALYLLHERLWTGPRVAAPALPAVERPVLITEI